jgi:hypothetical protein
MNMKIRNRFIAGLCSAALAASVMPVSADSAKTDFYEATADNVKILGRTVYVEDALWFANSVAGVEFTATGSQVTFNLKISGDPTRIGIFVNDKLVQRGLAKGAKKMCSVTVPLEDGENTVKFLKLSEGPQSNISIQSIEIDEGAEIKPAAAKAHKMEFIGDSITCGYGIDLPLKDPETGKNNTFSTSSEDASKTYAYQIAEMFDADVNFFSGSGYGIWCSYGGSKENTMDQYYNQCGPHTWNSITAEGYTLIESYDWDFSKYQPECVVINLGTNDWSYFQSQGDTTDFEESYIDFLKMVRAGNPDAKIICTLGLMGADLFGEIESAVDDYKSETDDENVYTFELEPIMSGSEGYAVDYHPTAASNTRAASKELGPYIAEVMGWELGELPDNGTLTLAPDNLVTGEFHEQPAEEPVESQAEESSASEAESESSGEAESSSGAESSSADDSKTSSTADSKASSAAANNTSSAKATTNPNQTANQNPTTGMAGGMAMIARMGGAVIISKRKK